MRNTIWLLVALAEVAVGTEAKPAKPVRFERNQGQTDARYSFLARARGQTAFFGSASTRIELHGKNREIASVEMMFAGSDPKAPWTAFGTPTGQISYQVGRDRSRWVDAAPQYARLERKNLYPGVDLTVYDGGEGRIEYDLALAAHADASQIRLRLESPWPAREMADGSIEVATPAGAMSQRIPAVYQWKQGRKAAVQGRFRAVAGKRGEFRLELGKYDQNLPLVVDPVIESARYFSGELDDEVVVTKGDYMAGNTASVDFLGVIGAKRGRDIFLQFNRISSPNFITVPSTIETFYVFGGSDDDELTAAGPSFVTNFGAFQYDIYLAGVTRSRDLPAATGEVYRGGASDGFLLQVRFLQQQFLPNVIPTAVYWGGSGEDRIHAMQIRNSTQLMFTGVTDSPNLPVTDGSTLAGGRDAFVASYLFGLNTNFATYLGGSGDDVGWGLQALSHVSGVIYHVVGETRSPNFPASALDAQGERKGPSDGFRITLQFVDGRYIPVQSRIVGGSGEDSIRFVAGLDFSPSTFQFGNSFLLGGTTTSTDFPLKNAAQQQPGGGIDGFAMRYLWETGEVVFSTYVGGSGDEEVVGGIIRNDLQFAVAGNTRSTNFPVKEAAQSSSGGGLDGFLASYNAEGALQSSTYYGGSGDDRIRSVFAFDTGGIRIVGSTTSSDLPNAEPYRKDEGLDGFFASIGLSEIVSPSRAVAATGGTMSVAIYPSQASSNAFKARVLDPTKLKIVTSSGLADETSFTGAGNVLIRALVESGETDIEITGTGFATRRIRVSLYPGILVKPGLASRYSIWSGPTTLVVTFGAWNRAENKIEGTTVLADSSLYKWTSSQPSVATIIPPNPNSGSYDTLTFVSRGETTLTLDSELPVFGSRSATIVVGDAAPTTQPARLIMGKDLALNLPFSVPFSGTGSSSTREIRVRSTNPEIAVLNLINQNPAETIVIREQQSGAVGGVNIGETTIIASSPDWDREIQVPVEVRRTIMTFVPTQARAGGSCFVNVRLQYEGSPFFFAGFRIGHPGLRLKVTSSNPEIVATRSAVIAYPREAVVFDCKAVGTAQISVEAESPDPGIEVRGPIEMQVLEPLPNAVSLVRTSKNMEVAISGGSTPNVQGPFTYRIADPSLAGVAIAPGIPHTAEVQTSTYASNIRIAGYATSGFTTLIIRNPDRVLAEVPIQLTPAAIGFSAAQVRMTMNEPAPGVAVVLFGMDPATGAPYGTLTAAPGISFQARLSRRLGESATLSTENVTVSGAAGSFALRPVQPGLSTFAIEGPPDLEVYGRRARMDVTVQQTDLRVGVFPIAQNTYREARVDGGALGGPLVRVESLDPTRLLLSLSANDQGSASIQTPRGQVFYFIAQDRTGEAPFRISGDGYKTQDLRIEVVPLTIFVGASDTPMQVFSNGRAGALSIGIGGQANGLRPGISYTVTLESASPSIASVENSPIRLSGNLLNTQAQIFGKGAGSAAISVRVSPALPINRDRFTVNVKRLQFKLGNSFFSGDPTPPSISKGLSGALSVFPENGESLQDNVIVRATSLDPSKLLLGRAQESTPAASVSLAIPANSSSSSIPLWIHALDSTGTAAIRLSADGFDDSITTIQLTPLRLSWDTPIGELRTGEPSSFALFIEPRGFGGNLRPDAEPIRIPLRLDPEGRGQLSKDSLTIAPGSNRDTVQVTSSTVGSFAMEGQLPSGVTAMNGSQTARLELRVRALPISSSCGSTRELGKDLSSVCEFRLAPGTAFTVTSSDASALLVSHSESIVGSGSISGSTLSDRSSAAFYLQALASSGDAKVTLRAPGYEDLVFTVSLLPTQLYFYGDVDLSRGAVLVQGEMRVLVGLALRGSAGQLLSASGQTLRAGAGPLVIPLNNSNPGAIRLQPTSISIPVGSQSGTTLITPVGTGTSVLTMQAPAGWTVNGTGSVLFDVQLKPMPFVFRWDVQSQPLPRNMSSLAYNSVGATPGIPITITSSEPSRLLLQRADLNESISITSEDFSFIRLVGTADSGTADLIVTAPGYIPQRHTIRLGPSVLWLVDAGQSARTVSLTGTSKRSIEVILTGLNEDGRVNPIRNNYFRRQTGLLDVTLTSTAPNVARPAVTTVQMVSGASSVQFDLDILGPGTSTIRAAAPGYASPVPAVDDLSYSVTAPASSTKLFSCISDTLGATTVLDMMTAQCTYTGPTSGTVAVSVADPSIVGVSFDNGPMSGSVTSATPPRLLRLHGLRVGQSQVTITGPGSPSTTIVVDVLRPFIAIVEPANGTLNVAVGSEGAVKLQVRVSSFGSTLFPAGAFVMRPGANLQAIPFTTIGNGLTIRGTQGSEVRFSPGQDTVEFRVIAAQAGVTTLRMGLYGPFVTPPAGFRSELLVNAR